MSRKQCEQCEGSGQNYLLNPCDYCAGTGFEISPATRMLIDPLRLAKKVMGVEHCRCDLIQGDHPYCPYHSKEQQEAAS